MPFDPKFEYEKWLATVDEAERPMLDQMCRGQVERSEGFFDKLAFGTGGLRGRLGMGLGRLNVWTVGAASQGLADYLNSRCNAPSVAVARDTRLCSATLARRAAEMLASSGVKVWFFRDPEPTPLLSFAVRDLGCSAGVVVTASHNPKDYNGYKVYGPDGCQATVGLCRDVQAAIDSVDAFAAEPSLTFEEGLRAGSISFVGGDVQDRFLGAVLGNSTGVDCSGLKVAYTPLNGTGLPLCLEAIRRVGVRHVSVVPEQAAPDGEFPTCPRPNPELPEAMSLGMRLARAEGCDLLVATDPDCDRVGVAAPRGGEWRLLSGNELGLLLLDLLARRAAGEGEDMPGKVACTTVVSAPMADDLARKYGFELRRTMTGFKFVGEQIGILEAEGRERDFLMGFEESCGYLVGTQSRDKCGIVAAMLACEASAYWKSQGKGLWDAVFDLYGEHGWWGSRQVSVSYDGPDGKDRMAALMGHLRAEAPARIGGLGVVDVTDFLPGARMPVVNPMHGSGAQTLPPSDVLRFGLTGDSSVLVRPSGTEPKVKAYVFAKAASAAEAERLEDAVSRSVEEMLRS